MRIIILGKGITANLSDWWGTGYLAGLWWWELVVVASDEGLGWTERGVCGDGNYSVAR